MILAFYRIIVLLFWLSKSQQLPGVYLRLSEKTCDVSKTKSLLLYVHLSTSVLYVSWKRGTNGGHTGSTLPCFGEEAVKPRQVVGHFTALGGFGMFYVSLLPEMGRLKVKTQDTLLSKAFPLSTEAYKTTYTKMVFRLSFVMFGASRISAFQMYLYMH